MWRMNNENKIQPVDNDPLESKLFIIQHNLESVLKALQTYFLNQLFTVNNGVLHEHKNVSQSWNSFVYCRFLYLCFSLSSSHWF